MKYSLLALAASTALTGVSARHHLARRHAHPQVEVLPREEECPQTCSTYVTTIVRAKTLSGTAPYYGTAPTGIAGTGTAPAGTGVPASSAGGETTTYTVSPIYAPSAPASSEISAVSSVVPAAEESTSCSEYVLTTVYSSVVYSTETSVAWVSPTPEETSAASTPASSIETAPASSAPASSAPVSSAPVSSAPVSSAPVSSAPVSSAPASSAPAASVPASSAVSSEVSPASSIATPVSTSPATSVKPLPTPLVTTCSTTGVYTIPARTVTITSTETTVIPKTVTLTRGVNTYGGSTTSVPSATTLTVPIATVATTEGTTTSYITQTTYFCPVAGSYTIGASTSTVTETNTVVTCPGVTAYTPGTYTQTELTTTITKTNEVITCPFEGTETTLTAGASSVATSVPASTTAVATSAASSTASLVVASSSIVASSSAPSFSSTGLLATASSSPSKTSSAIASPSSSKGLDTSGLWSIAYSPYDNNGACKAQSDITTDIADIAKRGFKNVRLYSTDCSGLDYVGSACENNGMGLIAGIFLKEGGVSTGDAQLDDLLTWGKWDLVELLVVGNECVYNNYCTAKDLADYVSATAKKVASAGYTGKVTTTEPVNIVQENADVLCPVMDVVGVNVQPYFDGAHTAEEAGTFAKSQLGLATTACGGSKSGVILEIGWPTKGTPHGVAVASPANQKTALTAIESELPGQCNYFTYRNDEWKEPGDFGVETNFGCADTFAIGGSASVSVGGISASVSAGVSY